MDYPNRIRMKLLGRVSIIEDRGEEIDQETLAQLEVADYRAAVERGFLIHVEAFDWNCPQHITPRYSEAHIQDLLEPLETENRSLKTEAGKQKAAAPHNNNTSTLGSGPLELIVTGIHQLTPRVRSFELRSTDGSELPEFKAGAHLQIPVKLDNQQIVLRHYSICSDPIRRDAYEIAVLRGVAPIILLVTKGLEFTNANESSVRLTPISFANRLYSSYAFIALGS